MQPLITSFQNASYAPKVSDVLWRLNHSKEATKIRLDEHLLIELYVNSESTTEKEELIMNIIKLLRSIALYNQPFQSMTDSAQKINQPSNFIFLPWFKYK